MSVAMTTPRSAREAVFTGSRNVISQELRLDEPRFFVQMGWDALHTDTSGVPNRYMLRGEITPVRSYQRKASLLDIREGDLVHGSEEVDPVDPAGRAVWGKYWCRAYYEAERILEVEGNSNYKSGIVEIETLRGRPDIYEGVDFNQIFFPGGLGNLPARNVSDGSEDGKNNLRDHLVERLAAFQANPPADIAPHFVPFVVQIGGELIRAVDHANAIQNNRLQLTHSGMKLKPGEDGFKREYDAVDREMLLRTGIPPVHSAEIATAKALGILTERSSSAAPANEELKELVAILAQQQTQQQKLLEMLIGDKAAKKTNKE